MSEVWKVPHLVAKPPAWLADLAEVTAGVRIGDAGSAEPIPLVEQGAVLASLRTNGWLQATNLEARCARWLLADPGARTLSPFTAVTVPEQLAHIPAEDVQALRRALFVCPTNAPVLAHLGWKYATQDPRKDPLAQSDADFLSRRAAELEPGNLEVLGIRAMVLARVGKNSEAIELVSRSIAALARTTNAGALGPLLLARAAAYRAKGRFDAASADTLRGFGIPARDRSAPARVLDLTLFYNAVFDDAWLDHNQPGMNLASICRGLQDLRGVVFDLRGIVQLAGRFGKGMASGFPESVSGIPVNQKAASLHFLHGTEGPGLQTLEGKAIARYVIHFADGQSEAIDVVFGRDIRTWHFWPQKVAREKDGPELVWSGPLERWKGEWPGRGARLYRLTWKNRRPEIQIKSLDLISTMTDSCPFVIAITAEP
jgi:hypothetical protein